MKFKFFIFLSLLAISFSAQAVEPSDLLEPDKAFQFYARLADPQNLEVRYIIADGYYLYRDNFRFEDESKTIFLGKPAFPKGKEKDDPFFGKTTIYRGEVRFKIPFTQSTSISAIKLKALSQGCSDAGICYPPQAHLVVIPLFEPAPSAPTAFEEILQGKRDNFIKGRIQESAVNPAGQSSSLDESAKIADLLKSKQLFLIILSFLGFGLLLSFTPCVLPMIPILSGIIVGHGHQIHSSKLRGFVLSLSYVLGMAVIYALIGVIAGLSGNLISASLQNPWVLGSFAAIFVALALSMFGLYELQLPHHVGSKLAHISKKIRGGNLIAAFVMGGLSAAIVSPCVAPPLAGALLYIGQTKNAWLGAIALFSLAIGMGIPLLLIGASAGALLPKKGPWMNSVKSFFGVLLLAVAIWIISSLISVSVQMMLWGALFIISAIYLNALSTLPASANGLTKLFKGIGIITLVIGIALLIGALAGSKNILQPLNGLYASQKNTPSLHFQRIKSVAELEKELKNAGGSYAMLDFYADWCVACKEMERFTFSDPQVAAKLNNILLLQVDVTANSNDDQLLLKKFNLFGPPGIILFDRKNQEIRGSRVVGYQNPEKFLLTLDTFFN
jgi:thiol:disulfide interchange protein DsbD